MSAKKVKLIRLSKLLKVKFIELDLKGNNKIEIISELVELIASSRRLKNKKAFLTYYFSGLSLWKELSSWFFKIKMQ